MKTLRLASHAMPAIKEFFIVFDVKSWQEESIPSGSGPMTIFEEVPYELQMYMWWEGYSLDSENGFADCLQPPDCKEMTKGLDVAKATSIWGWRPTNLPGNDGFPAWMEDTLEVCMESRRYKRYFI